MTPAQQTAIVAVYQQGREIVGAGDPVMVRLGELGHLIEKQVANFDNPDTSDIDPELLELADKALVRIDARRKHAIARKANSL